MSILIVNISLSAQFARDHGWWFHPGTETPCPLAIEECARGVWSRLRLADGKPPFDYVVAIEGPSNGRIAKACYRVEKWQRPPAQAHFPRRWSSGTTVDGIARGDIQQRWEFTIAQNEPCEPYSMVIGKKFNGGLEMNGCCYATSEELLGLFV